MHSMLLPGLGRGDATNLEVMKMRITLLFTIIIGLTSLRMDAALRSGNGVFLDEPLYGHGMGLADHSLTAIQNFDGDYTVFFFDKTELPLNRGASLTPVTWNIDEGADYYLVPFGIEFSERTIDQFSPFLALNTPTQITVPYGDFYLGVNTGVGSFSDPPNFIPRDVYGWVKLRNTPTGLEMLDNVMAYDTGGLFIGTRDVLPIPEPGAGMALPAMLVIALASRRSRQAEPVGAYLAS